MRNARAPRMMIMIESAEKIHDHGFGFEVLTLVVCAFYLKRKIRHLKADRDNAGA